MKTIEIAPSLKNTHILKDTKIVGRLKDGSRTYVYDLPKPYTFPKEGRKEIKHAFSCAIFIASKAWQVEDALNKAFGDVAGKFTIIEGPAPWIKPCPKFNLSNPNTDEE